MCNDMITVQPGVVSIIIPVYNGQDTIERTLISCLEQKYESIEIIVVDDGSKDLTRDKVSKFLTDRRIKYIYQNNMERSCARNMGLQNAKGEFIQFLDADDSLHERKICDQVAYLRSKVSVTGVYGPVKYVSDRHEKYFHYKNKNRFHSKIWMTNFIPINSMLLRRDVSIKFKEDQKFLEDWRFIIDYIIKNGEIEPIDCGLAIVNLHERNSSNDRKGMRIAAITMLKEMIVTGMTKNTIASHFQLIRLMGFVEFIKEYSLYRLLQVVFSIETLRIFFELMIGKFHENR